VNTQTSIYELEVRDPSTSTRAQNVFYAHGITTIEQLVATTEKQLLKFRNCGRKTVREIRAALQKRGLDLSVPTPSEQIKELRRELRVSESNIRYLRILLHRVALSLDEHKGDCQTCPALIQEVRNAIAE
jgi:hypothetical protein